jgi:hypothetical protein
MPIAEFQHVLGELREIKEKVQSHERRIHEQKEQVCFGEGRGRGRLGCRTAPVFPSSKAFSHWACAQCILSSSPNSLFVPCLNAQTNVLDLEIHNLVSPGRLEAQLLPKAESSDVKRAAKLLEEKLVTMIAEKGDEKSVATRLEHKVDWNYMNEMNKKVEKFRDVAKLDAKSLISDLNKDLVKEISRRAYSKDLDTAILKMTSKRDFNDLESRVARLEEKFYTLESSIDGIPQKISDHFEEVFTARVDVISTQVEKLAVAIQGNAESIDKVRDTTSQITDQIVVNKKNNNGASSHIDSLSQEIQTLQGNYQTVIAIANKHQKDQHSLVSQTQGILNQVRDKVLEVEGKFVEQSKGHQIIKTKFDNLEELSLTNQQKMKERFRKIVERYDGQDETITLLQTSVGNLRAGCKKLSEQCTEQTSSLNAIKGPLVDEMRNLRSESQTISAELLRNQEHYRGMANDYTDFIAEFKQTKDECVSLAREAANINHHHDHHQAHPHVNRARSNSRVPYPPPVIVDGRPESVTSRNGSRSKALRPLHLDDVINGTGGEDRFTNLPKSPHSGASGSHTGRDRTGSMDFSPKRSGPDKIGITRQGSIVRRMSGAVPASHAPKPNRRISLAKNNEMFSFQQAAPGSVEEFLNSEQANTILGGPRNQSQGSR